MVFSLGDARVYRLRDGRLARLTVDHSLVGELLRPGRSPRHRPVTTTGATWSPGPSARRAASPPTSSRRDGGGRRLPRGIGRPLRRAAPRPIGDLLASRARWSIGPAHCGRRPVPGRSRRRLGGRGRRRGYVSRRRPGARHPAPAASGRSSPRRPRPASGAGSRTRSVSPAPCRSALRCTSGARTGCSSASRPGAPPHGRVLRAPLADDPTVDPVLDVLTADGLSATPSFLCAAVEAVGARVVMRGELAAAALGRDGGCSPSVGWVGDLERRRDQRHRQGLVALGGGSTFEWIAATGAPHRGAAGANPPAVPEAAPPGERHTPASATTTASSARASRRPARRLRAPAHGQRAGDSDQRASGGRCARTGARPAGGQPRLLRPAGGHRPRPVVPDPPPPPAPPARRLRPRACAARDRSRDAGPARRPGARRRAPALTAPPRRSARPSRGYRPRARRRRRPGRGVADLAPGSVTTTDAPSPSPTSGASRRSGGSVPGRLPRHPLRAAGRGPRPALRRGSPQPPDGGAVSTLRRRTGRDAGVISPRPTVARLVFDSGLVVEVDRPQLIGRRPTAPEQLDDEIPNLVTVPSPDNDVSRIHTTVHLSRLGRARRGRRLHQRDPGAAPGPGADPPSRARTGAGRPRHRGPLADAVASRVEFRRP